MIILQAEQSMHINGSGRTRIACLSGVVWLTRAGDPRDFILTHGDHLDVERGSTVITALEPTVITLKKRRGGSWLQRLAALPQAVLRSVQRRGNTGELQDRPATRSLPVPYY